MVGFGKIQQTVFKWVFGGLQAFLKERFGIINLKQADNLELLDGHFRDFWNFNPEIREDEPILTSMIFTN